MSKVKVAQGWLEGELLDLVTGDGQYYSFKGIPYAAPPLGKLRFKAPQPPQPWDGLRKATAHGAECPQKDIFTDTIIPGNEDCLFLNVYTRDLTPKTPLPVMVFIHGGGFKSGSGNETHYGPDFLVNHGVLLVTINYRLEVLGFLCLDTEDVPGNAGLKDQVAALRWVKENIKNFGGDPDNVTVFGESAGGASTMFHVLSPMSKGLFKRAISMSGVPSCDWALPYKPRQRAFILGKLLGKDTDDPKELLEFLQSVPVEKLIDRNPTVLAAEEVHNGIVKMYHFTPVVEKDFGQEYFLTDSPHEVLRKKKHNEVDLLIGHTNEEALIASDKLASYEKLYNRYLEMYVPRKILIECKPDTILEAAHRIRDYYLSKKPTNEENLKKFADLMTDALFVTHIHRFVGIMPKIKNEKRFFYIFSSLSERNVYGNTGAKYNLYGASHLDDLMYLFDAKLYNIKVDKASREYKLIQLANTVFTNFAKFGTPTPDKSLSVTWPEYDNNSQQYVEIGDVLIPGAKYKADNQAFWKSIFEYAGVEF